MDYRRFQSEHAAWLERMYPRQTSDIPAYGMVEEAGELLHAVLKTVQRTVWGEERRHGDLQVKLVDAIGDCGIYVCSFCNAVSWSFDSFAMEPAAATDGFTPLELSAALIIMAVENARLHSDALVRRYVATVKAIASVYDIDFADALRCTWNEVQGRSR